MSGTNVARVTEIIAESPKELRRCGAGGVRTGRQHPSRILPGRRHIVEQRVSVKDNKIDAYRVKMEVIFILE